MSSFQSLVKTWLDACFGKDIASDKIERNYRFLEESLELVQSCGLTQDEAHQLVDYVFTRPVGEPEQEVGGVMTTLAALCLASGLDMHSLAFSGLQENWIRIEKIREKQKNKPIRSPLPGI